MWAKTELGTGYTGNRKYDKRQRFRVAALIGEPIDRKRWLAAGRRWSGSRDRLRRLLLSKPSKRNRKWRYFARCFPLPRKLTIIQTDIVTNLQRFLTALKLLARTYFPIFFHHNLWKIWLKIQPPYKIVVHNLGFMHTVAVYRSLGFFFSKINLKLNSNCAHDIQTTKNGGGFIGITSYSDPGDRSGPDVG